MSALSREVRATAELSFPLIASQVGQVALGALTAARFGAVSTEQLAAGGLAMLTFSTALVISTGCLSGVTTLVAEQVRSPRRVRAIVVDGARLAGLLCLLVMPCMWTADLWLPMLGQRADIAREAARLLRIVVFGFPLALAFALCRNVLAGKGNARSVAVVSGVGLIVAAVLGSPTVGRLLGASPANGAALALVTAHGGMALLLAWHTNRSFTVTVDAERVDLKATSTDFRALAWLGAPVGFMFAIEVGLFTAGGLLAGSFGATDLAAHQIALYTTHLTFMVPSGISLAATSRVGRAFDDRGSRTTAAVAALLLGTGCMAASSLVLVLAPGAVVSLYLRADASPELIAKAIVLLHIAALFQLVDGAQGIAAGALRGLRDTEVPAILGVACYWGVGGVTGYALAVGAGLGVVGVWWGLACALGAAAIALGCRLAVQLARSD